MDGPSDIFWEQMTWSEEACFSLGVGKDCERASERSSRSQDQDLWPADEKSGGGCYGQDGEECANVRLHPVLA